MATPKTTPVTTSGADIIKAIGIPEIKGKVAQLTGPQRAGLRIAFGIGAVATLVILGLGIMWYQATPTIPTLPVDMTKITTEDLNDLTQIVKEYQSLSDVAVAGPSKLFDQVVVNVLYPLFTLILGYIFGERVARTTAGTGE